MAREPGTEQATGTQLLDRTVAVIKLLGEVGEKGARMGEIAEGLGPKTSTAHRIVSALERHGLEVINPLEGSGRGIRLGG